MATRGIIAREVGKNEVECLYSHWDNYLEHNGVILSTHYNTKENIKELFAENKEISSLGINVKETSFYDGSGEVIKLKPSKVEKYANDCFAEYIYLFTLEGIWKYKELQRIKHNKIVWSDYKDLDTAIKAFNKEQECFKEVENG